MEIEVEIQTENLFAMKKYELDERFENFAALVIVLFDRQPASFSADYLAKQLIRSACSSALNFGEFEGAGSNKDKSNKLRLTLKELRESMRNLNIQLKANILIKDDVDQILKENDELIRITVTLLKKYS